MEKELELSFRTIKIREILFVDISKISSDKDNQEEISRKTLKFGSDLIDEEIDKLTVKEGLEVMKQINELNGFTAEAPLQ